MATGDAQGVVGNGDLAEGERVGGPRSRKGATTRARIVSAAKEVFEEHGFLDARIADIAERAGMSHGAFYHYFDSKEAAFLDVAAAQEARFDQHSILGAGFDSDTPEAVAEQMRMGIRSFLEEYRSQAPIMAVIEQVSRHHEPVQGVRLARYREYLDLTERSIAELQRRGWVDPELDPGIVAAALVATVTRFAELWFVQRTLDCDFDTGVEQLSRLCLNVLQLERSIDQPVP